MRIGLLAPRLAQPDATGIGRYVRELVTALAAVAGSEAEIVVTSAPEAEAPSWLPDGVVPCRLPWARDAVHLAWCLGSGPRLERALGAVDVVHLLYPFPPARSRAPQVTTYHDLMPLEHPEWFPRSEPAIYRRSVALTRRRSSRIVVPSHYVAGRVHSLLDVAPSRVSVVPLGVTGRFAQAAASVDTEAVCAQFGVQPGRFAVAVGAVSVRKNLIPLIRGLAESAYSLPLVVIGPDGFRSAETQAEIERVSDRVAVRRTGWIPDGQVAALVKEAAVLVHPALEEGFGIVPLEAMAVGTPVVAARVSAVPEVTGDAAILVEDPTDPRQWAGALAGLLDDGRRDGLTAAGAARVAAFNWRMTARAMLEIYREVAAGTA